MGLALSAAGVERGWLRFPGRVPSRRLGARLSKGSSSSRRQPAGYHPGRTAAVALDGMTIGHVGELSPMLAREYEIPGRVAVAELDLEPLLTRAGLRNAESPSVYPPIDFDLSFVLSEEIPASALLVRRHRGGGPGLVESAHVFDEFRGAGIGEGERALAIRYRLRAPDRTLTNEEVAPVRDAMIEAARGLGAQLRGA